MRILLFSVLSLLGAFASPMHAAPVLKTDSGICHCPGGDYYDGIKKAIRFGDVEACIASGGREPKRGQGDCSSASAVAARTSSPSMSTAPSPSQASRAYPPYQREAFGAGWMDVDRNCMNTRHEILRATSTGRVTLSRNGCSVTHGRWNDPYTNRIFTDPGDLDIDHIVPLSFAWHHGAHAWTPETRMQFANDPINLIAVDGPTNRQKSDSGPLKWLPPNVGYRCEYMLRFTRISKIYGLTFSAQEAKDMTDLTYFLCD